MKEILKRFLREEEGQGMVEYGLILALIAIVVIVALTGLGESIRDLFSQIAGEIRGS